MQRYTAVRGAHRLIFMGARIAMVVRSASFGSDWGEDSVG